MNGDEMTALRNKIVAMFPMEGREAAADAVNVAMDVLGTLVVGSVSDLVHLPEAFGAVVRELTSCVAFYAQGRSEHDACSMLKTQLAPIFSGRVKK